MSEEHNSALAEGFNNLINAGVNATREAFYIDGKYAEMVGIVPFTPNTAEINDGSL
jgi:hypothetical protein